MRISDWSSDVCSSDLRSFGIALAHSFKDAAQETQLDRTLLRRIPQREREFAGKHMQRGSQKAEKRIAAGPAEHIVKTAIQFLELAARFVSLQLFEAIGKCAQITRGRALGGIGCNILRNRFAQFVRSEEHTSELESLMRF